MEMDEDEKLYCLHCNLRAIKEGKVWQNSSENTLTAQTEKEALSMTPRRSTVEELKIGQPK